MQQSNYSKEQVQKIKATEQEMDAWEALRREPGLMGRLARRGKHMKRDYVGGRRSFQPPGGGDKDMKGKGDSYGDSYGPGRQRGVSGDGGSAPAPTGPSESEIRRRIAAEEKSKKEAKYKKETEERTARRAELSGEYGGYKKKYGDLEGQAEYGDTRDALSGYQTAADKMAGEAGTKFGGYESQIGQMADRGAQVAGYGEDVAGLRAGVGEDVAAGKEVMGAAGQTMGEMATKATDTGALMEDRGLFAGQIEAKRKAGQKGKLANLRRSMAAGGASPQEIARAEAEASGGGAQASREDALAASMASMQSKQGQMAQAQGMLGAQAQFAGQRAGLGMQGAGMQGQLAGQAGTMAGQAQGLGLQRTQAQAGMYGQGLQAQTGLMQMGSTLANQQQQSMQNQITQQQGLIGSQAGMTDAQMQDVVAQQNAAQQADLAERGLTATANAQAANAPKGPAQQQQLMGLVKTGAMVKVAMACIPEGTKIDTPDGGVAIEKIKVGDFVIGMDNKQDEVLQVHQYKEDPEPARFATVTFDDGSMVNCCDKHRISNKRAEDYKLQDNVGNRKVTNINWYNGVNRSYDLLTATGGYRINGVPVNTMIPEMAEAIVNLNNKLAA